MTVTSIKRDGCRFVQRLSGPVEGVKCERPIELLTPGDVVVRVRCRYTDGSCELCAWTQQQNVRRVAHSGVMLPGRTYMLTLTAPGEREHRLPSGALCKCTPVGGVDLKTWNGRMVDRWNDLSRALARQLGVERIEYFKAVEVQKRGALHMHILIRLDGECAPWTLAELRKLVMHHGYGHAVDLGLVEDERAAFYVSKYVAKSSTERKSVPYVNCRTGEVGPGRWRTWTASRRWGASMATVRLAQRLWCVEQAARVEADEPEARGPAGAAGRPIYTNTPCYATRSPERPPSGLLSPM
jgi:hypothetical protein